MASATDTTLSSSAYVVAWELTFAMLALAYVATGFVEGNPST